MKQVNIALLGMGRIGKIHFKNIEQHFHGQELRGCGSTLRYCSKEKYGNIFFSKDANEVIALHGS